MRGDEARFHARPDAVVLVDIQYCSFMRVIVNSLGFSTINLYIDDEY